MKIYPVHVLFWIISDELDPKEKNQFTKIIPVPFVPYLMEGKRGHIYFKDANGKEMELPFTWGEIKWTCDGTKNGYWGMFMEIHPPELCARSYIEALSNDVRFSKR